jgi:hypothetical protein
MTGQKTGSVASQIISRKVGSQPHTDVEKVIGHRVQPGRGDVLRCQARARASNLAVT